MRFTALLSVFLCGLLGGAAVTPRRFIVSSKTAAAFLKPDVAGEIVGNYAQFQEVIALGYKTSPVTRVTFIQVEGTHGKKAAKGSGPV